MNDANTSELEMEKWERMRSLHEEYNALRRKRREEKLRDDSGTAAALLKVFGAQGSPDNAWWTRWRPPLPPSVQNAVGGSNDDSGFPAGF
jgi:hypothetical protein